MNTSFYGHETMDNQKDDSKLDGRDELILMIIAFVTPLAVLPVFFGG